MIVCPVCWWKVVPPPGFSCCCPSDHPYLGGFACHAPPEGADYYVKHSYKIKHRTPCTGQSN